MRLDRNENADKRGKYALVKLRNMPPAGDVVRLAAAKDALRLLESYGILDWGTAGTESEFFVIRLKDKHAQPALYEYALDAYKDGDAEYADDVRELASRAGPASPWCKKPD